MFRSWVIRMAMESDDIDEDDNSDDWELPESYKFDSVDWQVAQKNNFVGIAWSYLGDCTGFSERNKDLLIKKLKKLSNWRSKKNCETSANSILRFVNEININDIVFLPTYTKKGIIYFIGRVKSPARFLNKVYDEAYARTRRDVEWIISVPRERLSEPLKKSLKGRLTVFNLDKHKEEIAELISGKQ